MKYKSNKKAIRDELLVRYREENPNYSLAEIGRFFGITRQRVSQILKKLEVTGV